MPGPDQPDTGDEINLHASCVAVAGKALLIRGASGSGKSSLALQMMGLGAVLVADDQVLLRCDGSRVLARAPEAIRGLIEMRGVGLLRAEVLRDVPVVAIVDMDHIETERLPPRRETRLLGRSIPLLNRVESPHFAAGMVQLLKAGRQTE